MACEPPIPLWLKTFGAISYSTVALCITVSTIIYIKAYIQHRLKTPRHLFYVCAIFFIFLIVTCIVNALSIAFTCNSIDRTSITGTILYVVQAQLLLVVLGCRLFNVFKNSAYTVSCRTIWIFIALWLIGVPLVVSTLFLAFTQHPETLEEYTLIGSLGISAFVIFIGMSVWLNLLFITKLLQVFELNMHETSSSTNRTNAKFLKVATNGALLCLICTLSTVVTAFWWVAPIPYSGDTLRLFFLTVCRAADLMTNALSIFFSVSYFHSWYLRICGCCHRRCYSCLTWYMHTKSAQEPQAEEEVEAALPMIK